MQTNHYFRFGGCRTQLPFLKPRLVYVFLALAFLTRLGPSSEIHAQNSPSEYQVKAAYLFNFLKFVEWPGQAPGDAPGPWMICVVGENPFGNDLTQAVSGKSVQGHELMVKDSLSLPDLHACHILFVSASEKKRLPAILAALKGSSALTVADMENFTESGGMIQFMSEDGRVRFVINVGAASGAGLKVSSKLLSLAQSVTGTEGSARN